MFEATRFASPCEVSRQTITNHLAALEATFVAHVVRPFSTRRCTEIVAAPKVYAFDTGFVCFQRGWEKLRPEDLGFLWEHFVLPRRGAGGPVAVECKWRSDSFEADALAAFRHLYPEGESFVVAPDVEVSYTRAYDGFSVEFVSLEKLIGRLSSRAGGLFSRRRTHGRALPRGRDARRR